MANFTGKSGPRPKPTALKLLHGTFRNPSHTKEPTPEVEIPPCPQFLTNAAKTEWRRLTAELEPLGLVSQIDRGMLALVCESWARLQRLNNACNKLGRLLDRENLKGATTEIQKELATIMGPVMGELEKSASGEMKVRALARARNDAEAEYRRNAQEFGLSPSARSRINVLASGGMASTPAPKRAAKDKGFA
jgi:P27 family predicted phage terminase small subunit